MTIQDFGVTYDELEPFFDKAECSAPPAPPDHQRAESGAEGRQPLCGGSLQRLPAAGAENTYPPSCSKSGAGGGLSPIQPAVRQYLGLLHQPVRRADGPVQLLRFLQRLRLLHVFQSFAERQHSAGAAHGKRFELRTNANVLKVNLTDDKSRATGVNYVDAQGREIEQPADLVIPARSSSTTCT